jgi:hypothetical protein
MYTTDPRLTLRIQESLSLVAFTRDLLDDPT